MSLLCVFWHTETCVTTRAVLPFPLQCNRINVIVGDAVYAAGEKSAKEGELVPRLEVLAHAAAVRPIAHGDVLQLAVNFMAQVRERREAS